MTLENKRTSRKASLFSPHKRVFCDVLVKIIMIPIIACSESMKSSFYDDVSFNKEKLFRGREMKARRIEKASWFYVRYVMELRSAGRLTEKGSGKP